MLRLTINGIDAELYENAPVNLKLQYSDVTKIQNAAGSFSQTFRLPLTPHNRTIFNDIDEVGLRNGLNLQQRLTASLHSGTLPLMTGYVQVKAVYMTKEHYAEVEVAFFSGALDLKTELGGQMLSDLDLSAYDHDLTYANVSSTWAGTGSLYPEIRYMLMDKGSNWSVPTNPVSTSADPLPLAVLNPAIQAKALVDAIMSEAGFTYESTYLNSTDFADVYMPCWNGSVVTRGIDVDNENLRATLSTSNQTITGGNSANLNLSDSLTGCYDPGTNYSTTTDIYTAPFAGLFTARLTYSWSFSGAGGNIAGIIRFIINNNVVEDHDIVYGGSGDNEYIEFTNFYMASGDQFRVNVFNPNVAGGSITFEGSSDFTQGVRTSLELEVMSRLGSYEVGVAENLPVMQQIDFLTSLQKMYNLVFVPDRNRPNHLVIDTYENYMGSGADKDWTNKIDYSKDVKVTPTTDLQAREYEWTHAPGMDFLSTAIQDSLDRVYGRYKVTETDNEFAVGNKVIQTGFAPYLMSLVPGTANPMYRGLTSEGKGVAEPLPMLAYWCGLSTRSGVLYLLDESGTTRTVAQGPFFSNYSSPDPAVTDYDLNFGVERPLYAISVNPRDTLYIRFWAQYVKELYSSDSRIVQCSVRLNDADLADLEFNDVVFIRNTSYRIISMTYDANTPSVAKVELLMRLEDLALCAQLPTGLWSSQNVILFNNSNPGAPQYGSQECCEFYGYRWDVNRVVGSRCRPQTSQLDA
jgi:hypothetical protein